MQDRNADCSSPGREQAGAMMGNTQPPVVWNGWMSLSNRRVCLTALAVINLYVAAVDIMIGIWMAAILIGPLTSVPNQTQLRFIAVDQLLISIICASLLLIARTGYRSQCRISGRYIGSAYALVSLTNSLVMMGGSFEYGAFLKVAFYPLLTLFLVNAVLTDDLVN